MNHSDKNPLPVDGQAETGAGCGCGGGGCGGPALDRREFMRVAGLGMLATTALGPVTAMAGPFNASDAASGHLVPADKKLDPAWVRSLYERGAKEVFSGADLDAIGMPCGGIGSGQMYLCGDGTLGCWQIFNNAESLWVDKTNATFLRRSPAKPVFQRFAAVARDKDGTHARALDAAGFQAVEFKGEYPIAQIAMGDPSFPLKVSLEAFSPFIPLNAADSALPATLFHYTLENTSGAALEATVAGMLENPVLMHRGSFYQGRRTTRITGGTTRTLAVHGAEPLKGSEAEAAARELRGEIVFADFEGADYGNWKAEGDAFGTAPAKGTLPHQQPVTGFEGAGLVNSFNGGDDTRGRLVSPVFTVSRRFVNFLVGGGSQAGRTEIQLVVDGKPARTAAGLNTEALAWRHWDVSEFEGREARIVILDDASGGWGHINADQIIFADKPHANEVPPMENSPDYGTMCLALSGPVMGDGETAAWLAGLPLEEECPPLDKPGDYGLNERRAAVVAAAPVTLQPGGKHTFVFAVAWHFPNQANGHYYAARFPDAAAAANYLFDNHERLTADTRLWRDTYYDSTLPYWLLDRLLSTVSTLATGTCQWWANGRFYAYEGVTCCQGTCTHVWNYSHTEARLFPELTRRVREMQDFRDRADGGGFHPDTGLVGFRSDDNYAADGQCGTILKAYREHLMSADGAFLDRNWPRIRKALEFSIGKDENGDGLIEDLQHNTFDINFFGANTFVGSLYLAALRAAEEMALETGDREFAAKVRGIYEKGRANTEKRLWNGEYFVQEVDLKKHPKHQYAEGCLSDQLFGQGWAHQLGLGYIYDLEKVLSALRAVWKYNWAPDIGPFNDKFPPFRWFIAPGQAGLFTCTWPRSEHLKEGVLYREEVWTGIEYQVAGHMAAEGMVEESLAICRAVHDRYHPRVFNPYNEIECGDHYARAMASWGVYLSLAGFYHHGPAGVLGFNPRMTPENYKGLFTTAEGWLVFAQQRGENTQSNQIRIIWGSLRLKSLRLGMPAGKTPSSVTLSAGGRSVEADVEVSEGAAVLSLPAELVLHQGAELSVTLAC